MIELGLRGDRVRVRVRVIGLGYRVRIRVRDSVRPGGALPCESPGGDRA